MPDPYTLEWIKLRNYPLPMILDEQALQSAFIQKTYLSAWEVLLQTAAYKDKPFVLKLMQIIGKLSPHISNAKHYAKQLFKHTFPTVLLKKLTTVSLDWGLHIACGHFSEREVELFAAELDPALSTLLNDAQHGTRQWQFTFSALTHKPYPSFLHYILERFYIFGYCPNLEFTHVGIKLLLESILADAKIDYNAEDNGMMLLIAACRNKRKALVAKCLQDPDIDINKKMLSGHTALDCVVENDWLTMVQALLAYGVAATTHVSAFNYALKLKKDEIAHLLWQRAKANPTFIEQALVQAITANDSEVIHKLIKSYQANPQTVDAHGFSAVNVALKKNDILLLKLLLLNRELKAALGKDENRKNVLHYAIGLENYPQAHLIKLVKGFLAAGADCNAIDENGKTPLMLACQLKQEEVVSLLLQQQLMDVNVKAELGMSALYWAIEEGTVSIVEKLLHHAIDFDDYLSAFSCALMLAKKEMALLLWQKTRDQQAFVNQALAQAIKGGLTKIIYELINVYAANPNVINEEGLSALAVALNEQDTSLVDLLLKHPDFTLDIRKDEEGKVVLHYIALMETYSHDLIRLGNNFIQQGGDCNIRDKYGYTPLMLACRANQEALACLLLQQPCLNTAAENGEGFTALGYAVMKGTVSMVQALLDYGTELDDQLVAFNYAIALQKREMIAFLKQLYTQQDFIKHALSWALKKGQMAAESSFISYSFVIQQLIEEHGADPESIAEFYPAAFRIALREALQKESKESMALLDQLLQAPTLKIHLAKDHHGNTPLLYAVALRKYPHEKKFQLIKRLLSLGVEVNATNKEGRTALMLACKFSSALIPLLLQHPTININIQDKNNASVLDYAISENNIPLIHTLLKRGINTENLIKAFNEALAFNKEILDLLWQAVEMKEAFINQALIQAIRGDKYTRASKTIYKLLKAYDANPDAVDEYGASALNIALKEAHILLMNDMRKRPVFIADKEAPILLIDEILKRPAFKVEVTKDRAGNTALIYALKLQAYPEERTIQLVQRLIAQGADCNTLDDTGCTPLIIACQRKQEKSVHLLLQQPHLNINTRCNKNKSALDCAIKRNAMTIVHNLLCYGIDFETHLFAFNEAIKFRRHEILKVLWQNVKNKEVFVSQALIKAMRGCEKSRKFLPVIGKLIKDFGADPNIVDETGLSPLLIALQKNDIVLLDMLLQHPELNTKEVPDKKGNTLLHTHIELPLFKQLNYKEFYFVILLSKIKNVIKTNYYIATSSMWVHSALMLKRYPADKHIALVKRLLIEGADGKAMNALGMTPLMALANADNGESLLPLLFQYTSSDIHAKSPKGMSALDYALNSNNKGLVQALLKHDINMDTLLGAFNTSLECNKSEILSILWPAVQLQEGFNHQALRLAITNHYAQAAYRLIKDYGANPNTVDALGFSALNVALRTGHIFLINRLLPYPDLKVKLDKDTAGSTALIYALSLDVYAEGRKVQLVRWLLDQGADCNAVNKKGKPPLIIACAMNQFELVKLLLSYAPDMNATDNEGNSALDYAVLYGTVNLVQALLAYGVAPDTLLSAFNQAVHFNKDSMAEMLLQHVKK
jgi:ankyrin repeat protein